MDSLCSRWLCRSDSSACTSLEVFDTHKKIQQAQVCNKSQVLRCSKITGTITKREKNILIQVVTLDLNIDA